MCTFIQSRVLLITETSVKTATTTTEHSHHTSATIHCYRHFKFSCIQNYEILKYCYKCIQLSKHIIQNMLLYLWFIQIIYIYIYDNRKRKQSESQIKRNCLNSTKLNSVSSHAKQIWRNHSSTLSRVRVNWQLMSENVWLGEIKIKPKQRERKKQKRTCQVYTIFNAQFSNSMITIITILT